MERGAGEIWLILSLYGKAWLLSHDRNFYYGKGLIKQAKISFDFTKMVRRKVVIK
jgi:hypothetical protein